MKVIVIHRGLFKVTFKYSDEIDLPCNYEGLCDKMRGNIFFGFIGLLLGVYPVLRININQN